MAETDLLTLETRLAALEAKLAALTATTPTTYYTHQYSGEEIDAAVGRALTGGALDTSVTNVSKQLGTFVRPNLLDNWYFGRPVNQRGQTEYTGKVYGVDRWSSLSNIVTMVVGDDGLTVSSTAESGATEVCQYFESYIKAGTMLTLSAIVSKSETSQNGIIRIKVYGGGADLQVNLPDRAMDHELVSVTNAARADVIGCVMRISNGDGYTVHAIKLELGPTQTLAHQDAAGNWVLNEVPEYGEQLRRCQRYFVRLGDDRASQNCAIGFANCANTTTANAFISTPVSMRTTPAITLKNIKLRKGITDYDVTAINVFYATENGIYCSLTSSGLPTGETLIVRTVSAGYMDVSADL